MQKKIQQRYTLCIYFLVNAEMTEVVPTPYTLLLPSVFVRLAETAKKSSVRNTLSVQQYISSSISASCIFSWIFFPRVNQLSVLTLIMVPAPPRTEFPQLYGKDPGHSAKIAGGRLQQNTHAPFVSGFE